MSSPVLRRRPPARTDASQLLRLACLLACLSTALAQVTCPIAANTRSLAGVGVAGTSDGVASGALFNAPTAVAYAPPGSSAATGTQLANGGGTRGTLWVADTGNHRLRRVDVATGVVETLAGVGLPGLVDGDARTAAFQSPQGVAVTASGTVYIADTGNGCIRSFWPSNASAGSQGAVVTVAGQFPAPQPKDSPQPLFVWPRSLAWDEQRQLLYIGDGHAIRAMTPSGKVTTLAGVASSFGLVDGTGNVARFNNVTGLALDTAAGVLYVADARNHAIRMVTLGATAATTTVSTLAGGGSAPYGSPNSVADGVAGSATFKWPLGISIVNITSSSFAVPSTSSGGVMLLVSEAGGHRLRLVNATDGSVRTVAGGARGELGFLDGVGIGALLYSPAAVVGVSPVTGDNTFAVVVDTGNHALRLVAAAVPTVFALDARANGTADSVLTYNDATYPFASYSVLRLPGGSATDVYDEMLFNDESHAVSWCSYSGGGEGNLVLRGAMEAQLYRVDTAANGTSSSTRVLSWKGTRASDVRVVPLARLALPQDDACNDAVPDSLRVYGLCGSADAGDTYSATLTATCTSPVVNYAGVSVLEVLPSPAGYSLDGPGLHVSSDEYAFVGGMYPEEVHVVNVTLRRGGRYLVQAYGSVSVTLVGLLDGLALFNSTGNGTQTQQRIVVPSLAGCMNPNAANYNPHALADDGTCIAPGRPAQVTTVSAPGLQSPDAWFSFGIYSVGGAGDDDLAAPVVPPRRFAAASQTAVLVAPLAPGLYYVEMYGNVSGSIQVFEPPDVPSALVIDAPGGLDVWDYTAVGTSVAAPLITFNASGIGSGTVVPPDSPLLSIYPPGLVTPAVISAQFAWGTQFDAMPTNLDPYGTPLAGGAVRAYFSVPARPSSHAFFTTSAGGAVAIPTAHQTAAAWVPSGALGSPGTSLRCAVLTNLTATSAPPLSLGRVVSDVYALLPLDATIPALTQPLTVLLPYDIQDADGVAGAMGPFDAPALVVITASDASGQDWHVLPNATFVNGLAVFATQARGVYAVSTTVQLMASLPPVASSHGGSRILLAGMGVVPSSQALCRFGADAGAFAAATVPPPTSATGGFRATLACVVPPLPAGVAAPLWVTLQFFSADALSSSAGAGIGGVSTAPPMFLFAAPPRVLAVQPGAVSVGGGAVLRLTGERLAPPSSSWNAPGQPDLFSGAGPWLCGTSGFATQPGPAAFVPATVVSSALALCESATALSSGQAAVVVGATGGTVDVSPFPDGMPGGLTYAPGITSAVATGDSSRAVSFPWGGDVLEVTLSGGPASIQAAAMAFRLGTLLLAARPGHGSHTLQAVAPAGVWRAEASTVPLTVLGLAPGEPDIAVESISGLAAVATPVAEDVHPTVTFLRGQDTALTLAAVTAAGDAQALLPSSLAWLCVLDGASFTAVTSLQLGAATCLLPPIPIGTVHALTLRLGSEASPPAGGLQARNTLAPHAHIVTLPLPAVTHVHPSFFTRGGGTLLWLTGLAARAPPAHEAAIRVVCFITDRASGQTWTSDAFAVSSSVLACDAPPAGGTGITEAVLYAGAYDTATGAVLAAGAAATGAEAHVVDAPVLQLVTPPAGDALADAGGTLLTLRGDAVTGLAGLSCAFGTISPVAPSRRSGTSLACTAPAHAPAAAVPLQLSAPGGWRSTSPHTLVSFAPAPSMAPQVVTSDATSVTLAVDAVTAGALACLFDASPMLAVPQQLDPSATWQLVQCLLPAPGLAALPLRFVTLRVVLPSGWPAGLQAVPGGEGAPFQFAPPAPRIAATQPEVAPLWGGALLTVSGAGFTPGDSAIACTFTSPYAWPSGDTPPPSPGNVDSSALLRCEAPAAAMPLATLHGGDAQLTVVVTPQTAPLASTAASASVLLPTVLQVPLTSRAVPALGGTGGGTGVDVAGAGFTPTGLPLQCQFGTITTAAVVANATALSCVSPAAVPRRVPLVATPYALAATGPGNRPSFLFV